MNLALDASAIIAFLSDEHGAAVVDQMIVNPANVCYVHAVNLCEVYYDSLRVDGEEGAQAALSTLAGLGIIVSEDMDAAFWQEAGRYKAGMKLPLGDCFLLAMANRVSGRVVTADRRDLEPVEAATGIPVTFIR